MSRIGVLSGAYYNSAAYGAPTFAEIKCVGDLAVNPSYAEGDASTRDTRVMLTETTQAQVEVTGRVKVSADNAAYEALLAAFLNDTPLDFLFLNGKKNVADSHGYRFWGKVFTMGEDQALGNVLYRDITIKPCIPPDMAQIPQAARVSNDGATITFSEIGASGGS